MRQQRMRRPQHPGTTRVSVDERMAEMDAPGRDRGRGGRIEENEPDDIGVLEPG